MLALCAHILIWLSVSGEKAPNVPFLALLLKGPNLGAFWAFSTDTLTQIKIWAHSANIPASYLWINTPHVWPCLDVMKFSLFDGRVTFWSENPPSWWSNILWKNQVQPQFFGNSILFHHYLLYTYVPETGSFFLVFFYIYIIYRDLSIVYGIIPRILANTQMWFRRSCFTNSIVIT